MEGKGPRVCDLVFELRCCPSRRNASKAGSEGINVHGVHGIKWLRSGLRFVKFREPCHEDFGSGRAASTTSLLPLPIQGVSRQLT